MVIYFMYLFIYLFYLFDLFIYLFTSLCDSSIHLFHLWIYSM